MKLSASRRTPAWVWSVCLVLASIDLATHIVLRFALPMEIACTGLHIADDSGFLPSLRLFQSGFFSPYVTALHEQGPNDPCIFGAPVFWLLGVLGLPALVLNIEPFLWLGFLNGAGLFFYLWAAYRFLCAVWPEQARLSFVLFALGGGLGGILYLFMGAFGLQDAPWFETFFHRYARYELIEGPFLAPWLSTQRLYYTAPLAMGFAALAAWHRHRQRTEIMQHLPALALLFAATYWNARLGPLFWLVLVCRCLVAVDEPVKDRVRLALMYAIPVFAAVVLVSWQMNLNPVTKVSTFALLRRSIWIGSLAPAAIWQILAAWPVVRGLLSSMPLPGRVCAGASVGYLGALALLYAGYQTYWGNWRAGGDASAAMLLSDWALPGALLGALLALRSRHDNGERQRHECAVCARLATETRDADAQWPLIWFLVLCAAGVAALGQGRLLVMMPERCMVLMGLPLAVLAARGLSHVSARRPRLFAGLTGTIIACGICSLTVSSLFFQAPLAHTPGKSPFSWLRADIMTRNEATVIDLIDNGVVLAPASSSPLYGDLAVARRPGLRTVFGQGTFAIGDQDMAALAAEVTRFFDAAVAEDERGAFLVRYAVDYIFIPEIQPIADETLRQIANWSALEEIASVGKARLFRVRKLSPAS